MTDWKYLDAVMCKMLFPVLWQKWIKECVSTNTASVLVNGSPTDEFRGRGAFVKATRSLLFFFFWPQRV